MNIGGKEKVKRKSSPEGEEFSPIPRLRHQHHLRHSNDIAHLYSLFSSHRKHAQEDLDALLFGQFNSGVEKRLSPYRRNFYTIAFFEGPEGRASEHQRKKHI